MGLQAARRTWRGPVVTHTDGRRVLAAVLVALAALAARAPDVAPSEPERPRVLVDTTPPPVTGKTIVLRAGGDLQAALDAARPGDAITLPAGVSFRGPFTLPKKTGDGWIVVRTADAVRLPPAGTRVTDADAALMPRLESGDGPVIETAPGAHHFRFVGIEVRPTKGTFLYNLVQLGDKESRVDDTPHHIIFDRCYLHGDRDKGTRRGIALNSRYTAIIDSILVDFKESGADTQALCGWNGPGPFAIINNRLEAGGENVMFGGADPLIPGLVASDIEVRRNQFTKPLAWKAGTPEYQGTSWTVKNLFELKNARRVLVDGNLFEHNWAQAQTGFAILYTVRNEDGRVPWAAVEDVTFTNNIVRGVGAGVNILGRDAGPPGRSGLTRRLRIANNLFEDVGSGWGGSGILVQVLEGAADVVIEHNTSLQTGSILMAEGTPHDRFVFRDNIVMHNEYGINGSGTGTGSPTLQAYFPNATVRGNVIVGGASARYPAGNAFPADTREVGFTDAAHDDYSLAPKSRYRSTATDGSDPGVDLQALRKAVAKAEP
jgi:hypothetical protein